MKKKFKARKKTPYRLRIDKNDVHYVKKLQQKQTRSERMAIRSQKRKIDKKYRKYFANNQEWTKLHEYYKTTMQLFKPLFVMVDKIKAFEPYKYLNQDQNLVLSQLFQLMHRDALRFREEIKLIYDIHKDKKGDCSIEDWQIMIDIGEKYFIFKEYFGAIIPPIYDHIIDLVRLAEENKYFYEQLVKEVSEDNEVVSDLGDTEEVSEEVVNQEEVKDHE